jgi:putative transferase (TIGR04331 family)
MDVPTVIYWDESQWELRDSARAHFAALKRAKIFHDSPESAANHVAAIWDAVEDWWSSDAVREVLRHFKQCYCDLPLDLLSKVESSLRESTHIAC